MLQVVPSEVGSNLSWNFIFKSGFWRGCGHRPAPASKARGVPLGWDEEVPGAGGEGPAVAIHGLRKVFKTTDGGLKAAVDGLQLDVERGEITALLGNLAAVLDCHSVPAVQVRGWCWMGGGRGQTAKEGGRHVVLPGTARAPDILPRAISRRLLTAPQGGGGLKHLDGD